MSDASATFATTVVPNDTVTLNWMIQSPGHTNSCEVVVYTIFAPKILFWGLTSDPTV